VIRKILVFLEVFGVKIFGYAGPTPSLFQPFASPMAENRFFMKNNWLITAKSYLRYGL